MSRDPMLDGRIGHIRSLCESAIKQDEGQEFAGLTNRAWLAQSVINILNGRIDKQIVEEINEASMKTSEPGMNIINQINAGLNDVRTTLVGMTEMGIEGCVTAEHRVKYELELIIDMIDEYKKGIHQPWSDRKQLVEEEFS